MAVGFSNTDIHGILSVSGSYNLPTIDTSSTGQLGEIGMSNGVPHFYSSQGWQAVSGSKATLPPPPAIADIEYLVVAGGGGGGAIAGAGGAGGLLSSSLSQIESGSSITVTVGSGGAAKQLSGVADGTVDTFGGKGTNSSIASAAGTSFTTVTALGGGAGGYYAPNYGSSTDKINGGSGGSMINFLGGGEFAGVGTTGQGNDGHIGTGASPYNTGGGGGAGADATSAGGGDGKQSAITGTLTYYAGGGGNSGFYNANGQSGGQGGGADGAQASSNAVNATANTGGGGGGGGTTGGSQSSGLRYPSNGGSGVVILAYNSGSINAAGGLVGDAGDGKKYHQLNESGTFKIGSTSDFTVVTDNLKLHLDAGNFNSRGSSTWTDLTSTGYDATLVSSPTLTDYYYNFDGSADYGTFTSTAATDLQNDTEGSIETWVYGDSFTNGTARKTIFGTGHSSSTSNWVVLRITSSNGIQMSVWNGSTSRDFKTGSVPSTGTWLHIVATATSNGTGKIYLNGVSQSITYASGTAGDGSSRWFSHSSTNTLQVGALDRGSNGNNYDPWDGRIAQVRYYTDVLTDAEVLQNYNATKTNFI